MIRFKKRMNHVETDVDEGKKREEKKRCYQATDAAKNWRKKNRSMRSANHSPLMYCHR